MIAYPTHTVYRPVFLKVGGIAPLGAILMSKRAKKMKGVLGG